MHERIILCIKTKKPLGMHASDDICIPGVLRDRVHLKYPLHLLPLLSDNVCYVSKSYSSFRLTLFSVHNIGGLCQHVPFGTLLDITTGMMDGASSLRWTFFHTAAFFASMDVFLASP